MKEELIFVYGTLKRGKNSPLKEQMKTKASYIEEATIIGSIYLVSYYPGLVFDNQGNVHGELYKILDPSLLDDLDQYEGCSQSCPAPHEYRRLLINIKTFSGLEKAWCYEYLGKVNQEKKIHSGCF